MEKVHRFTRNLNYCKHTISYVEHLCSEFSQYYKLYEDLKIEVEEEKIWSFTSKDLNTKINSYRSSDVTAEAALRLNSKNKNPELQQMALFIKSVVKTYNSLNEVKKNWFYENLLDKKTSGKKRDKEEKRLRYEILALIAQNMGIPEDGGKVKKMEKVEHISEERLRVN